MAKYTNRKIITKPRILHRAHVKKDLEKMLSTPLFFVIASMGFGKTTAVRFGLNSCENGGSLLRFCRDFQKTE